MYKWKKLANCLYIIWLLLYLIILILGKLICQIVCSNVCKELKILLMDWFLMPVNMITSQYCLMYIGFPLSTEWSLNSNALSYLVGFISKHVPSCFLHSNDAELLNFPRTYSKYGDQRFSVWGPLLWNALPQYVKDANFLDQFKRILKTFLFSQTYSSE